MMALVPRWLLVSSLTATLDLTAYGVPPHEAVVAFESNTSLERWAREVTATSNTPRAKADALFEGIRAWLNRGALVPDRVNEPKSRAPKTAIELFTLAHAPQGHGNREAGCYELSALLISAARAAGVRAQGALRTSTVDAGQIGHVMAALHDGRQWRIYDLQNQRVAPTVTWRLLTDAELAAHHYNHLAVAAELNGDLARGRRTIDWALALDPDEPALRHNRSVILEALGEVHGAVAESAWAVAYGPHVPMYRYQYGHALLSARRVADAVRWLRSAVHMRGDFALARRDLGWALLLAGEDDASLRELEGAMSAPEAERYYALALAVARGVPEARDWVARRDAPGLLRVLDNHPAGPRERRTRALLDELLAARSSAQ